MKKGLLVVLIVLGIWFGIVVLDTIQALVFNNNVLIGIETKCMKREGILVNTYHCGNGKNITKFKKSSSSCNTESVCDINQNDDPTDYDPKQDYPYKDDSEIIKINENISFKVKSETLTSKGATFVMTNNTDSETYEYGNPFYIEVKDNNEWKVLETINDLSFTLPAFALKPKESKKFNINWEYGYGKLKKGTYRLVKDVFRSGDEPIDESEKIYLYAEFTIK